MTGTGRKTAHHWNAFCINKSAIAREHMKTGLKLYAQSMIALMVGFTATALPEFSSSLHGGLRVGVHRTERLETVASELITSDRKEATRVREILATVKPLAAEYYRLTGKPLGVTGEVAEYIAADILGLTLVTARTIGYDALRGTEVTA